MIDALFIVGGLLALVVGGDWLLKAAVGISLKFNISKIVIGLTVVSFATSAPELIVSIKAAMDGFPDIALGNVIGSNISNIALVLGIVIVISAMKVDEGFFKLDWPVMMFSSAILWLFLYTDQKIHRWEGMVLFICLIAFVVYLIYKTKKSKSAKLDIDIPEGDEGISLVKIVGYTFLGGVLLWLGSELLVKGAVNLATSMGVSERVIAVTIVSIGTSIPELVASIIAAIRKESDLSIGNIVGSNIFNILSVLGLTAIIHPIGLKDVRLLTFDVWIMFGFAFILLPLVILPKKGFLDRRAGVILLALYAGFIYITFS